MNDTVLLMTGISVFSLMLVAIVMTILEFNEIGKQQEEEMEKSRRDSRTT